MFPVDGHKGRRLRVEIKILAQETPRLRPGFGGSVALISEGLDIAHHAIDHTERPFKWRAIYQAVVLIDGADMLAKLRVRPDTIARDGERTLKICETFPPGFALCREAESAIAAALIEPEACASIAIVEFDRHGDDTATYAEMIDRLGLFRLLHSDQRGARAKK